ncbi:unnamed protein product [Echinostoma caproni]|uniref:DUF2428 domain-containing protein n=1 Tax=Echinostoma caproni TaxID=27848 RepID=A0A183AN88_9TREM|nr:unnamed protein product [Echinostoma caproni]
MVWENLLNTAQSFLEELELKEDEESLSVKFWHAKCTLCTETCSNLRQLLQHENKPLLAPPVQVLMVIGGIIGNRETSGKLHRSNQLERECESLLQVVLKRQCHCTIRDLLLCKPQPSSQPHTETLALQFLRLCVAQIARSPAQNHEEALNYRPLFRDALIWLSEQLDYPEMAGDEFIGVLQPFGLRLCGDHRPAIQLAGLKLLSGLAKKARIADWRSSNRAEAVINQLFEHRLGCGPGSSELVLDAVYKTMFMLFRLLDSSKSHTWWNKIADRLLFDIIMEGKKLRLTVLLRHMLTVIQLMKTDFAGHSRGFLHAVSVVLLGPRTPNYLKKTLPDDAQDETVHSLMLQCIQQFIRFSWPIVSPTLLPSLISPLVAFVDLTHATTVCEVNATHDQENSAHCPETITEVLTALVDLEPRILSDILIPVCTTVPALKQYIPASCE